MTDIKQVSTVVHIPGSNHETKIKQSELMEVYQRALQQIDDQISFLKSELGRHTKTMLFELNESVLLPSPVTQLLGTPHVDNQHKQLESDKQGDNETIHASKENNLGKPRQNKYVQSKPDITSSGNESDSESIDDAEDIQAMIDPMDKVNKLQKSYEDIIEQMRFDHSQIVKDLKQEIEELEQDFKEKFDRSWHAAKRSTLDREKTQKTEYCLLQTAKIFFPSIPKTKVSIGVNCKLEGI